MNKVPSAACWGYCEAGRRWARRLQNFSCWSFVRFLMCEPALRRVMLQHRRDEDKSNNENKVHLCRNLEMALMASDPP